MEPANARISGKCCGGGDERREARGKMKDVLPSAGYKDPWQCRERCPSDTPGNAVLLVTWDLGKQAQQGDSFTHLLQHGRH